MTPTAVSQDYFITTESAIDTSSETSPSPCRRTRHKQCADSACRFTRNKQPSPAPTRNSGNSFSSSALDLDFDLGLSPDRNQLGLRKGSLGSSNSESTMSSRSSHSNLMLAALPAEQRQSEDTVDFQQKDHPRRDSTPQLIMPSPSAPKRRPFSDAGKAIGKLKILVTGPPSSSDLCLSSHIYPHLYSADQNTLRYREDLAGAGRSPLLRRNSPY